MVGFHNEVGSSPLTNWVSPQSQQIAFGRGSAGFIAVNNADSPWSATFTTGEMADGSYCDVISGKNDNGRCSGGSCVFYRIPQFVEGWTISHRVTVSGGTFTATVPSRSALAIHSGQKGSGSDSGGGGDGTVVVTFAETAETVFGENIFLAGSLPQLGSWDPNTAVRLISSSSRCNIHHDG